MLLLLHYHSDQSEVLVNTAHIVYARKCDTGGTFIQTSASRDEWIIVSESIDDILLCIPART